MAIGMCYFPSHLEQISFWPQSIDQLKVSPLLQQIENICINLIKSVTFIIKENTIYLMCFFSTELEHKQD